MFKSSDQIDRVNCTKIRTCVATEFAAMDDECTATLAKVFLKHRKDTLLKYYNMNMMQREAVRISWKVCQRLGLTERERKIAKVADDIYNKPKPGIKEVSDWYQQHKQKLLDATGVRYVDPELDEFLRLECEREIDFAVEDKKRLKYLCLLLMKYFDL